MTNYSFRYGPSPPVLRPRKPLMLLIASVPDDNTLRVRYMDRRGTKFDHTGNFDVPEFDEIEIDKIILGGMEGKSASFDTPDFAFNRICDPDDNGKGLSYAAKIVEEHKIPVLNHPEFVFRTRRDRLYERFSGFDGVVVPRTLRIAPRYCREVRALIDEGEIRLPCIFRPAGGHNSLGMFLIERPEDVQELERYAFDGRDYYVIEFVDFRGADGLYRKFRAVWIDGRLYPRHMFISEDWKVSSKTVFKTADAMKQEEEFLDHFDTWIGAEQLAQLKTFCGEIGLDFFGLDAALLPNGNIVVFEANPCMAFFYDTGRRHYVARYVEEIRVALKEMLLRFYRSVKAT